ncbi:hypothetical protein P3T22_005421 [Paraburkholderia sp. GAS348]
MAQSDLRLPQCQVARAQGDWLLGSARLTDVIAAMESVGVIGWGGAGYWWLSIHMRPQRNA